MGAGSKIEWTHHTFNPWWGCVKVSPACKNCYAEAFAKRTGNKVWGTTAPRRFFGANHWREPVRWDADAKRDGERRRVFCASMADVFELLDGEMGQKLDAERERLWNLIDTTPNLDWLLLTKRPENIMTMVPERWRSKLPDNIWLGTTAENQEEASWRIPELLRCPAVVRFVSAEPLLSPIDLAKWLGHDEGWHRWIGRCGCDARRDPWTRCEACEAAGWVPAPCRGISWVIVGGESGGGSRPFDVAWARSVIEQCKAAGTACFVKQLGAKPFGKCADCTCNGGEARWSNGTFGCTSAMKLTDRKGGDMSEWPEDLRVREFPR